MISQIVSSLSLRSNCFSYLIDLSLIYFHQWIIISSQDYWPPQWFIPRKYLFARLFYRYSPYILIFHRLFWILHWNLILEFAYMKLAYSEKMLSSIFCRHLEKHKLETRLLVPSLRLKNISKNELSSPCATRENDYNFLSIRGYCPKWKLQIRDECMKNFHFQIKIFKAKWMSPPSGNFF